MYRRGFFYSPKEPAAAAKGDEVFWVQIVVTSDAEKADAIFNKLMGTEVELRKNFIEFFTESLANRMINL